MSPPSSGAAAAAAAALGAPRPLDARLHAFNVALVGLSKGAIDALYADRATSAQYERCCSRALATGLGDMTL